MKFDLSQLFKHPLSVWHQLHFWAAAKHQISLLLVERLNQDGSSRVAKPLWLAWVGQQMPACGEVWRLYLRRFAVDHWYRFARAAPALDSSEVSYSKTMCVRWSDSKGH